MSADYESRFCQDRPRIADIQPGVTVAYDLSYKDSPTHPNRLWHGKVICSVSYWLDEPLMLLVEIQEQGYEQLREWISLAQVQGTVATEIRLDQHEAE